MVKEPSPRWGRRVRRGTEEEKMTESQMYPQVTNNFTIEDLTLIFMGYQLLVTSKINAGIRKERFLR